MDDYRLPLDKTKIIDVKPRLSSIELNESTLHMAIGKVCYQQILEDRKSFYSNNGTEVLERLKRGYNEKKPFSYLASSIGVTALVETSDSKLIFGNRTNTAQHPSGKLLHGISGYCELGQDFYFKINPEKDVLRELEEETGITPQSVEQSKLLGLCFHELKIGMNFVFRIKVDKDASYFSDNGYWKDAVDQKEHSHFTAYTNEELPQLLKCPYLHYSIAGTISHWLENN